jgi:hypothetical protein
VRAVIPGHGAPFTDVSKALDIASSRIDYLSADPARNAKNALKVLIVFKLMELRSMPIDELLLLIDGARLMRAAANLLSDDRPGLVRKYLAELAASGALKVEGETVKIA